MAETNPIYIENRFAISMRSKERHDVAYNQEVLIDKQTGEILVKTDDGDIVSFDNSTRRDLAMTKLFDMADKLGIYGDVYEINTILSRKNDIPYIATLPSVMNGQPLQLNEHTYTIDNSHGKHINRVIVYIDADSFRLNESGITTEQFKPIFDVDFIVHSSSGDIQISQTYDAPLVIQNTEPDNILMNSIEFTTIYEPINYRINNSDTITNNGSFRTVLYNIFILVESY